MTSTITTRSVAVYGALRSGTTLLRLMLDAHPALSCPGETDFLFDHLVYDGDRPRCDATRLERDRIYRSHRERYADRPLTELTPDAIIGRIAGNDRIAVLMLHRNLERVLKLYPDMRFIHLIRDPRDVARSSIGMGWAGNVYYGIDHWIRTETGWRNASGRLKPGQAIRVTYEDLIRAPEANLRRICAFLDVDFDPAMLSYDKISSYSGPDETLVTQWKSKQTPEEIGLVEHKIADLLAETGYAPSGYPPRAPGIAKRLALNWQNRLSVWARRIERHGLIDPLTVAVARKLGMPALSEKAQCRMDDTTVRYLK